MSSENRGIQPLWPTNDRLLSNADLTGIRGQRTRIGKFIRRLSVSGKTSVGIRIPALSATSTMLAGALIFFYPDTTLATPAFVQLDYAAPQTPPNFCHGAFRGGAGGRRLKCSRHRME